jgi:hypothetical protein
MAERTTTRQIARIGTQAIISGALIASGITCGLNPVGASLAFAGFCLAFPMEEEQTEEATHFEELSGSDILKK